MTAAGPAGPSTAVAAGTVPAEIAHDERQAPHRPAAEQAGRHPARPAFPAGAPGTAARNGEGVTRPGRTEDAPAARPAAASWPVKDPHTPASLVSGTPPAGPAWTPPVPPAPVPPGHGDQGTPAGPVGPVAPGGAHPVPAMGDPVPAAGDPVPSGPDLPVGRADALAAPGTATPAGPAVSVPAQAAPSEPSAGSSAGPAGFFIGAVRPEAAEPEPARREPAAEGTAPDEPDEDRPAPEEPATAEPAAASPGVNPADLRGAVEAGRVDDQAGAPDADPVEADG